MKILKKKAKNIKLNSFWNKVKKNEIISNYTTLGIGGPAKYFLEVKKSQDLITAIKECLKNNITYVVIGSGSDLLVSDEGFNGLLIANKITGLKNINEKFTVGSGTRLQDFINYVIEKGSAGIEKMSGIPGTVGGAIYGNAGAYGQAISDHISEVVALDGIKKKIFTKKECGFEYRESVFKKKKYVICEAEFVFEKGEKEFMKKISLDTIQLRSQKYLPGLKCPGSFFKNIVVSDLKPSVLKLIPPDKIIYGKIPAGYLMEAVGAKGVQKGNTKIADNHGNLIFNLGGGTAKEFIGLAYSFADKVEKKFKIKLVPEVQLLGFFKEDDN